MKNHLLSWLVSAFIILGLGACPSNKKAEWYIPEIVDTQTTRLSASWDGVYTGIILSASGISIDALIMLNRDNTYMLRYTPVGKPENIYTSGGSFKWDETEEIIILPIKDLSPFYRVTKNKLIQLDMYGENITYDFTENFVLKKIAP